MTMTTTTTITSHQHEQTRPVANETTNHFNEVAQKTDMDRMHHDGDAIMMPQKPTEQEWIEAGRNLRQESWWPERKCLPHLKEAGPNDVICARGKQAMIHIGNKRLRALIQSELENYDQAFLRAQKSSIVTEIIDNVRHGSPLGGFIKLDESTGLWWEVGDGVAREKVGQIFRDALYGKYRSSTRMKILKKKCERKGSIPELKFSQKHVLEGPIHLLSSRNEETMRAHDVQAVKAIARGLGKNQVVDNYLMKLSNASSSAEKSVTGAATSSDGKKQVLVAGDTNRPDHQQRNHSDNGKGRHDQLPRRSSMATSLEMPSRSYRLDDPAPKHKNGDSCHDGFGRVVYPATDKPSLAEPVVGREVALQLTATERSSEGPMKTIAAPRPHRSNGQAIWIQERTAEEDSSSLAGVSLDGNEDLAGTNELIHVQQVAGDSNAPTQLTTHRGSASARVEACRRVSCETNDGQSQSHLSLMWRNDDAGSQQARQFPPIIGLNDDEVAVFDATLAVALDEILPPADPKALQDFSLQRLFLTYEVDGQVVKPQRVIESKHFQM